jgi:hypothetical protein
MALDQIFYGDFACWAVNQDFSTTCDVEIDEQGVEALAQISLAKTGIYGGGGHIFFGIRQVRFFDFSGLLTTTDFTGDAIYTPPVMYADRMTGITFEGYVWGDAWAWGHASYQIMIFH